MTAAARWRCAGQAVSNHGQPVTDHGHRTCRNLMAAMLMGDRQ